MKIQYKCDNKISKFIRESRYVIGSGMAILVLFLFRFQSTFNRYVFAKVTIVAMEKYVNQEIFLVTKGKLISSLRSLEYCSILWLATSNSSMLRKFNLSDLSSGIWNFSGTVWQQLSS